VQKACARCDSGLLTLIATCFRRVLLLLCLVRGAAGAHQTSERYVAAFRTQDSPGVTGPEYLNGTSSTTFYKAGVYEDGESYTNRSGTAQA
jgi:hypothetical protein